jgi:endoglucanase
MRTGLVGVGTLALSLFACSADPQRDTSPLPSGGTGGTGGVGGTSGPCTSCNTGPRLTGVNWFGFETSNFAPHGLWTRDYRSMLRQIKDLGFNCIRLPWCSDMLTASPSGLQINAYGTDAYTSESGLNVDLDGLSSIEVMDKILDECNRVGLKVILDNHSRAHDGYMNETLWYTTSYSEDTWISDWVSLIKRYKDNPAVVAADLKNEPHGNTTTGMKPPATWGYDESGYGNTDWRKAAARCGKAIVEANPAITVIVEGVENYKGDNYWWGGNLEGVRDAPITEIPVGNLWYSVHEYGPEVYNQPWFQTADFPNNMQGIWDSKFWFVRKQNIAPLFIGEFGIKEASAADPSSAPYKWLTTFMSYVGGQASWTFWSMNPNSGDTEGILKDDWVTVNQAKYNLIKPYLAP